MRTQEAEPVDVGAHPLDDDVIVFAGREVTAAGVLRTNDRLGEVIIGPGVNAGPEQVERLVRPFGGLGSRS